MLSYVQSRYRFQAQVVFCTANVFGLLAGVTYRYKTPVLYRNEKHGPIGWVAAFVSVLWLIVSFILPQSSSGSGFSRPSLASEFMPLQERRSWSSDSEHESERSIQNIPAHNTSSTSTLLGHYSESGHSNADNIASGMPKKINTTGLFGMSCLSLNTESCLSTYPLTQKALRASKIMFDFILLPLAFVCLATGIVVYGGIFVRVIPLSPYPDREMLLLTVRPCSGAILSSTESLTSSKVGSSFGTDF
jgi:hypothetical protein